MPAHAAGEEADGGENGDECAEREDRPQRDRACDRRDDDEQRERERPRGRERSVDAAGRPEPAGAVDRARADPDLDRVAELRRRKRVHEGTDPETGRSVASGDPAARGGEPGAPGADRARERCHEAGACGEEPALICAPQSADRRCDTAAEQVRRHRHGGKRREGDGRDKELAAGEGHAWAFTTRDSVPCVWLVGKA